MDEDANTNATGPRDVFLHLLETLALYISIGSFIALLFGFINIHFPDVLQPHDINSIRDSLRWPIAMLVVVYPFYLWLTRFIQRDVAKHPAKKQLKTRRWLLYLTPVLAIIIIAGDIITLVFYFLSGGLTIPFILKVAAVLILAAVVLVYYGWILRHETPPQEDYRMKWFMRVVSVIGFIAIISGLFAVGSPFEERQRRLDQQRINDLQEIQFTIERFYEDTETLPESLSAVASTSPGIRFPQDPQTNESYAYTKTGTSTYQLCANFQTATDNSDSEPRPQPIRPPAKSYQTWDHPAGQHCFDLQVRRNE